MAGRVLDYVTFGILLVAATFAVLALNTTWVSLEDEEDAAELQAFAVRQEFFSEAQIDLAYSEDALDEVDGIGMVRAGGVLLLVATLLVGVAALAAENQLLLGRGWLATTTAAACFVAMAALATGLIIMAIGMGDVADDLGGEGADSSWGFGFYGAIVAGAAALAATVTAIAAALRGTGFKFELADSASADFDA